MFENNLLHLFSMCQVEECGKALVMKPETSTIILPTGTAYKLFLYY